MRTTHHYELSDALKRRSALEADQRMRLADGADRECPEADHLDLLKAFEPHVSMFLLLAAVAFLIVVVVLALRYFDVDVGNFSQGPGAP